MSKYVVMRTWLVEADSALDALAMATPSERDHDEVRVKEVPDDFMIPALSSIYD